MGLEEIKTLVGLGTGGVLAGLMIYFYRRDFLRERNNHKEDKHLLVEAVQRSAVVAERISESMERLSEAIHRADQERGRQFSEMFQLLVKRGGP